MRVRVLLQRHFSKMSDVRGGRSITFLIQRRRFRKVEMQQVRACYSEEIIFQAHNQKDKDKPTAVVTFCF